MSRKRIWYWIEVPFHYWLRKARTFVPATDPRVRRFGGASAIRLNTMKQVERIWPKLPAGANVTRFVNIYSKKPHRKALCEWEKQ